MKKIKILFDVNGSDAWIGGVYYLRNILYQVCSSDSIMQKCDIIVVYDEKYADIFDRFQGKAELQKYPQGNRAERLKKISSAAIAVDWIYYYHDYKFDPLHLLRKKALYWIPDFQECYYPDFFSKEEIRKRTKQAKQIVASGHPLILSSNSCREDFLKYYGQNYTNIFVVPFVSAIEDEVRVASRMDKNDIVNKYDLQNKRYVMVSNQFWQHKNHATVFQAIAEANKREILNDLYFVFTGNLDDNRNREYIDTLRTIIKENGLEEKIRILGFISRKDQLALMIGAELIIQPSLFEGWGTVVEDCKVLDKTIVLSDIPVHKEQKNDKCHLFKANDPCDLLRVLQFALENRTKDDIEKGISNMKKDATAYGHRIENLIDLLYEKKYKTH